MHLEVWDYDSVTVEILESEREAWWNGIPYELHTEASSLPQMEGKGHRATMF